MESVGKRGKTKVVVSREDFGNKSVGKGKKKQKVGEEGSGSFDSNKFVSEVAARLYKENRSKGLVHERGIDIPLVQAPDVRNTLQFYGWLGNDVGLDEPKRAFAMNPGDAAMEVVHEFYANLKSLGPNHGNVVTVRGKRVNFSSKAINAFFSLKELGRCWYNDQVPSNVDWGMIVAAVGKPGTSWILSGDGEPVKFHVKGLNRENRMLFYLISARLMPSTHVSHVTKEKALLLYAMINRHPLNVGSIIRSSIVESAAGAGNRGYVMPSLITGLCQESGVVFGEKDLWEKPKRMLDLGLFNQMQKDSDDMEEDPVAALPSPSVPPPKKSIPAYLAPYLEQQAQLGIHFGRMEESLAAMRAQQESHWVQEQVQFAYTAGCFDTIHHMMAPLMETYGCDLRDLPPRPTAF